MSLNHLIQRAKQILATSHVERDWESDREYYVKRSEQYKLRMPLTSFPPAADKAQQVGLEFDPTIKNEQQLVNYILHYHCYLPQVYLHEEQVQEFGSALDECDTLDRRNIGSIIGMAILGVLGFVALGFTIVGMVVGGVLGILLGRYAGKRIKKKLEQTNNLLEFDVYEIRIRCFIKWAISRGKKYKYNINMLRLIAEKVLLEIKPALHYKQFQSQQQKQAKHVITKLTSVILKQEFLEAVQLSLLLSMEYLRILKIFNESEFDVVSDVYEINHFRDFRQELEICLLHEIDNVIKPFQQLLQQSKYKYKDNLNKQITVFLLSPEILQLNHSYPDPQMTISYIKLLAEQMKVHTKAANMHEYIKSQNFRDLELIGQQIGIEKQLCLKSEKYQAQNKLELIIEQPEQLESQNGSQSEEQYIQSQENQQQIQVILSPQQQDQSIKLQIKHHPNRIFLTNFCKLNSGCGDRGSFVSSQQINDIQNIAQIIEPEQQIQLEVKPQFVDINNKYSSETVGKFNIFLDYHNESIDKWECVSKKDDIYIYKAFKGGSGSVFLKGYALVHSVDKDVVFKAVYLRDFRVRWDKIMQGFEIKEHESEDTDIMYYYVAPPIPIVGVREWLQRRVLRRDFPQIGQICLMFYSVQLPNVPEIKARVRAHTEIAGYIFENVEQGTKISFISNNDVRGSIPKMLVNHASAKGPLGWFGNLRKACLQYNKFNGDIQKINI